MSFVLFSVEDCTKLLDVQVLMTFFNFTSLRLLVDHFLDFYLFIWIILYLLSTD